ncbi:uncharacterized protein [Haliotis cracherodii]|uniref:uncharacterized protein n=1 Tax=Haliotis cracherodii TaxID=6455 RepID=UPI0039EC1A64
MESVGKLWSTLRTGDWLISLDLQDAYLHVLIHPSSWKYLRLAINGQRYEFQVLPFGISIAPWLFTRITAPVIRFAHLKLVRIHGYLGDFLAADQEEAQLHQDIPFLVQLMTHRGFRVNPSKSETTQTQINAIEETINNLQAPFQQGQELEPEVTSQPDVTSAPGIAV